MARTTPIYMLTVSFKSRKRADLNVALGPSQETLYQIGDRDYGKDPAVAKINVRRVFPHPGSRRRRRK